MSIILKFFCSQKSFTCVEIIVRGCQGFLVAFFVNSEFDPVVAIDYKPLHATLFVFGLVFLLEEDVELFFDDLVEVHDVFVTLSEAFV